VQVFGLQGGVRVREVGRPHVDVAAVQHLQLDGRRLQVGEVETEPDRLTHGARLVRQAPAANQPG